MKSRWIRRLVMGVLPFYLFTCLPLHAQVGTWRNYLAYHDVQQIQDAGDNLFVMASNGLYQYNKNDQSITTYDKVNGLSDTNISLIRWCQQAKRLIAIYSNQNIDLIDVKGNVVNISDLYNKAITGDKTVNSITINGQYAYLACGFGIVKVNMKQAEISESYMLGFSVSAIAFDSNNIYAQSAAGIWKGALADNLIDKSNWHLTNNAPSFQQDNSDYDNNIALVKTLKPGGPKYNYFGFMRFYHDKLYTCNGDFDHSNGIQILEDNQWEIYQNEGISDVTGVSYQGAYCFDIDPSDENHLFTGSRNGLYEFRNGKFIKYYDNSNSPIEPFDGINKDYQLVTGTKFDQQGNFWLLNSQAPTASLIKLSNGEFIKYNKKELMKLNDGGFTNKSNGDLSNIIIDSNGTMWFVNNNWFLSAFYQYKIDQDAIIAYEEIVNQDGTKLTMKEGIRCVAEDLKHNIWVGTCVGPVVLESSEIESGGNTFTQIKVPRNDGTNYADYLLAGIDISSIAIDGANRKWFGTKSNGVYLISADNLTQLQHFTADNSSLLSNYIHSIAINPTTGEVFFGTENGLCSYVSDATETNTEMTKDNVWAYPNPVSPDYTGPITITGLSYNADVKILASNGAIVNEGRSNGGTYIWDGCDQKGRRVASGVYMVATATSSGEKGTVCKIAILN